MHNPKIVRCGCKGCALARKEGAADATKEFKWSSVDLLAEFEFQNSDDFIAGIERVLELHRPIVGPYDQYVCEHCTRIYNDIVEDVPYPCRTIKALGAFKDEE